MIVRNLAVDVVGNVRLRDTVSSPSADPAHDAAEVAKKVSVEGGESTTGESELVSTVVGEERVGVLEERDQDKPVVDPEVGLEVKAESVGEAKSVDRGSNTDSPDDDTDIRHDDLQEVVGSKEVMCVGVEVVSALGVTLLARGVGEQVHRPANDEVASESESGTEWAVADSFPQLIGNSLRDAASLQSLFLRLERRQTELGPGLRNEDLVLSHMRGGCMVLGVSDTPRVIGHAETVVE